jgi:hypothetical protein
MKQNVLDDISTNEDEISKGMNEDERSKRFETLPSS